MVVYDAARGANGRKRFRATPFDHILVKLGDPRHSLKMVFGRTCMDMCFLCLKYDVFRVLEHGESLPKIIKSIETDAGWSVNSTPTSNKNEVLAARVFVDLHVSKCYSPPPRFSLRPPSLTLSSKMYIDFCRGGAEYMEKEVGFSR